MIPVQLDFDIGHCNGAMGVVISNGREKLEFLDIKDNRLSVNLNIAWPTTITVTLIGKNLNKDTQIDQNGNIIANKYVKLTGVRVLGMDLIEPALYRILTFYPDNEQARQDTFWDRDGQVELIFDKQNPMRWNLSINNILNFRNE